MYFHYTHIHTYTNKHTHFNFHLLWHWTSSISEYILFFLVALINHMECKKCNSLVDISNFSKTEGLSGNQALNKNSSNSKKRKTTPIPFRTQKKSLETFGHKLTWSGENVSWQSYASFSIYSQVFQIRLVSLTFVGESFHIFALLLSFCFSRVFARVSWLLHKFKEKKPKPKNCLRN